MKNNSLPVLAILSLFVVAMGAVYLFSYMESCPWLQMWCEAYDHGNWYERLEYIDPDTYRFTCVVSPWESWSCECRY